MPPTHIGRLLNDPRVRRDIEAHEGTSEPTSVPRRRKGDAVSGWVCLDKPLGLGSTQAVGRVRRAFNAQKAGHAGTLDPLATGILPIALGEATKTVAVPVRRRQGLSLHHRLGDHDRQLRRRRRGDGASDVRPIAGGRRRGAGRPSSARSTRSRRPSRRSRWTANAPMTWPAKASPWTSRRAGDRSIGARVVGRPGP